MNRNVIKTALKAFTLIELITVVSIITILTSIAVPNILNQRRVAKIKSENDQAYQVYVATQDYLNHLQKYGKKATEYFYVIEDGKFAKGHCFLVVDEGMIDYNASLGAISDGKVITDDKKYNQYRENLNHAFVGICKYMGVDYSDTKRPKPIDKNIPRDKPIPADYADNTARFFSPKLHDGGISFAVKIDPVKYSVICAFATDFKTKDSAGDYVAKNTTSLMKSRLDGRDTSGNKKANYQARDSKKSTYTIYDNGFESIETDKSDAQKSQEAATKYGTDIHQPMYMGMYPVGSLK
jgi:prepilin-type N-terminal cleavage/methylation domain-containing protein